MKELETFNFDELIRPNNELVNIQRELAKKNQELDHLNKLKNQFLGIAAHDLRNPLGIILGFTDLMKEYLWPGVTVLVLPPVESCSIKMIRQKMRFQ